MKLCSHALLLGSILAASDRLHQVAATEESKLLLRVVVTQADCTITNEAQCDGQNWSYSTCCVDPGYECRWDDKGQHVKLCQKIKNSDEANQIAAGDSVPAQVQPYHDEGDEDSPSQDSDDVERQSLLPGIASSTLMQPGASTDASVKIVDVWASCTNGERCKDSAVCVRHSTYFSQCKPQTLKSGELCGQRDGVSVWFYDYCPIGEACKPLSRSGVGDFRCKKNHHPKKKAHHHRHHTRGKQHGDA